MKRKAMKLMMLILILISITGCFYTNGVKRGFSEYEVGSTMKGKFQYFDGEKYKKITCKKGEKVNIDYEVHAEEGKVQLTFTDDSGNELLKKDSGEGKEEVQIEKDGKYTIKITAEEAKGNYKVSWEND